MNEEQKQTVVEMIRNQELSEPDRLMTLNLNSMMAKAGYEPYGKC